MHSLDTEKGNLKRQNAWNSGPRTCVNMGRFSDRTDSAERAPYIALSPFAFSLHKREEGAGPEREGGWEERDRCNGG
jgi:hypothetical protein